jgi:MFS family permease
LMLFRNLKLTGLWLHGDFLRLWSGQTISVFGSMIGGTAMTFTAILVLHATPFQMALVTAMQIVPALLAGLFTGAWVDRLRRRPLLIGADIGRALVLATIPLAAMLGVLRIEQVYLVSLIVSILTIIFDVAYQSYLPSLVKKDELLEGNSKLSASASVAEFGGFSIAGWLVQIFSAPFAVLIDAASFVVSAATLGMIRTHEVAVSPPDQPNLRREITEGLKTVWEHPLLRASAVGVLVYALAGGLYGALVVLYMSRGLGFNPGVLGMIWAVGGISSFFGASLAPRITRRLGIGPAMVFGLAIFGVSALLIPLASGATFLAGALLTAAQLGDGFYVVYDINQVSLRQSLAPEQMLGRVNATLRFLDLGAALVGTLIGGMLGEVVGVRPSLFLGGGITLLAALLLWLSPLRKFKA